MAWTDKGKLLKLIVFDHSQYWTTTHPPGLSSEETGKIICDTARQQKNALHANTEFIWLIRKFQVSYHWVTEQATSDT